MLELVLRREASTATSTPGQLYARQGGKLVWLCYTLEDVVRPEKIKTRTAIPAGQYQVVISRSMRFRKDLPEVLAVPGFTGVRIHGGNTHENTEGCPLVGMRRDSEDRISNCAPAVEKVMRMMRVALDQEQKVTLTIEAAGAKPSGKAG